MTKHWAEQLTKGIIADRGLEQTVSIGVSPSGPIHVGFLREIIIGDVIRRTLTEMGANAKLVLTSDDLDPLRHVYPFLPDSFAEHVGHPLSRIPDPEGCCPNYAEHFIRPLEHCLRELGVDIEIRRSSEEYASGRYTEIITTALQQRETIARIIQEETGRALSEKWSPFSPICERCGQVTTTKMLEFDANNHSVKYECLNGSTNSMDYSKGEGKLAWRIDWAARWISYPCTVEPFGKDHAGAGGSYDTGKRFCREVFDTPPPVPVPYEWIELKGMGPMSSSKGVVITISDMIQAVPPQLLRYLIVRAKASKHISFDPGRGLIQLWDEYERLAGQCESDEGQAASDLERTNYKYSLVPGRDNPASFQIPFKHLAVAVQLTGGSDEVLEESLVRSGYRAQCKDWEKVKGKASFASRWAEQFAPEEMKLKLAKTLPKTALRLTETQRQLLAELRQYLKEDRTDTDIHNEIYELAQRLGMRAKEAFGAIYLVFLGAERGPRAGWFLRALPPEFVQRRLKEALAASGPL